jgi:hypothetical protein
VLVVADRAALEEKDRAFDALDTMTFVESQRVGRGETRRAQRCRKTIT